MTRTKTLFRCRECGAETPRWLGRCPRCGEWDTLAGEALFPGPERPFGAGRAAAGGAAAVTVAPVVLGEVPAGATGAAALWRTGVGELDRVLGGGLVPGSVTLLGGEPGIGKSTLTLQALAGVAAAGRRAMLVTGEESVEQVAGRAARLAAGGGALDSVLVTGETSMPAVEHALDAHLPDVVVVDSVQTLVHPELGSAPGSVPQVSGCAHALVERAKRDGTAVVLVGHVTKDGELAGPRVLEHVVDTVLSFEGDRHHTLRLLRVLKHRFGSTQELGVLEMTGEGLRDVPDPSGLFLADRRPGTPGSVVAPVVDAGRPLLVEVQALTGEAGGPGIPRRVVQGVESARVAMVVAVLDRHAGSGVGRSDVYVSVAGGLRVAEPGADLAVALALVSAASGCPVGPGTVALGEVGLGGEVRRVAGVSRRLAEVSRLGFERAIVPEGTPAVPGLTVVPVGAVGEAVAKAGLS